MIGAQMRRNHVRHDASEVLERPPRPVAQIFAGTLPAGQGIISFSQD